MQPISSEESNSESSPSSAVNVWLSHHTALPSEISSSRRLSHVSHVSAMGEPSASVLAPGQTVKAAATCLLQRAMLHL